MDYNLLPYFISRYDSVGVAGGKCEKELFFVLLSQCQGGVVGKRNDIVAALV